MIGCFGGMMSNNDRLFRRITAEPAMNRIPQGWIRL